jgi:hypothetical protein
MVICLYGIILFSAWQLINIEDLNIYIKIILTILLIFAFFFLYYLITWELEIHNTHFTSSFNLIFIPFKIILFEIFFYDIDWIDGEKVKRNINVIGNTMTFFEIRIYFKSGKFKNYTFFGKEKEFYDIIYNLNAKIGHERTK